MYDWSPTLINVCHACLDQAKLTRFFADAADAKTGKLDKDLRAPRAATHPAQDSSAFCRILIHL